MSNNSNDPKNTVTINEVQSEMKISINKVDNVAYVFIGKTPRAQLSIDLYQARDLNEARQCIEMMFPQAEITIQ